MKIRKEIVQGIRLLPVVLLLASTFYAHAQKEQDADTLIWNNQKYAIKVDRYSPSIVQDYFLRQLAEPPFHAWSTNNNRGHIAYFEYLNNELCLDSIEAKRFKTRAGNLWTESGIDTVVTPDYFDMHSMATDSVEPADPLIIDWFSGILRLRLKAVSRKEQKSAEANGERWLVIRNGKVVGNEFVTDKQLSALEAMPANVAARYELLTEAEKLWVRQRRLDDFYQRCAGEREAVTFMGHEGLFDHRDASLSLLMERYRNDAEAWDSEHDYTAAIANPMRRWKLMNDTLFLDDERRTWADWLNGTYVIHYGNWQTDAMGITDYRVYKTQKIRLKDGIVMSTTFTPRSFEEDAAALAADTFTVCDKDNVFSVEDKQLWNFVGKLKTPKKNPTYTDDIGKLRTWLQNKPLTDERAKERLFRVRIGFLVNCKGEAGQWQILNRGKGELNEFAEMVLDIVKELPQRWVAAEDKKGNKVDCWQLLEFTVSNGTFINVNYKK